MCPWLPWFQGDISRYSEKDHGPEEVKESEVLELLESHREELSNQELMQLEQEQTASREAGEDEDEC